MATLKNIFDKCGVALYQNESLDLDHYYQEPYQDEGDEIKVIGEPFETDKSKKIRPYDLFAEDRTFSNFSFFMDGSRRTYKIGDIVIDGGKKIYPVVIAQIRAGCTERDGAKKLHSHQTILRKNLLLLSDKINTVDFKEIQQRLMRTAVAKEMFLEVVSYVCTQEAGEFVVAINSKGENLRVDIEKSFSDDDGKLYVQPFPKELQDEIIRAFQKAANTIFYSLIEEQKQVSVNNAALPG